MFVLCIFLSALASAQIATPRAPDFTLEQDKLNNWLRLVDGLPDEPFKDINSKPLAVKVNPCGEQVMVSPIPTALPAVICYNPTLVKPAKAALGTVSDTERLNYLRMMIFRTNVKVPGQIPLDAFTKTVPVTRTDGKPGPLNMGPDFVNAVAGQVRFWLYDELHVMLVNRAAQRTAAGAIPAAVTSASAGLLWQYRRHLKLLDYMFPDAAAWEYVQVTKAFLPPARFKLTDYNL